MESLLIYNLFPRLAGTFSQWKPHMERAHQMGFNWIFLNPIQEPGLSGSLYSIKDYYNINPQFVDTENEHSPHEQLQDIIFYANSLDLKVMIDLVINHTAIDSPLIKKHHDWFLWDENGEIVHPGVREGDKIKAIWGDLAEVDNKNSPDLKNLWNYWKKLVLDLLHLGFQGFRCDAAYQVPSELWEFLITAAKKEFPNTIFLAETLGCPIEQTMELGRAGFDYTANSSKWWNWDPAQRWALIQYEKNARIAPSISFAETHDTPRLIEEVNGLIEAVKSRHLFAIFFSTGFLMPIGFEFGFHKRLHVVKTTPDDWEESSTDLQSFIKTTLLNVKKYPVLREEGPIYQISTENPWILLLQKLGLKKDQEAVFIVNRDLNNHQRAHIENLQNICIKSGPITDLSPDNPMKSVPNQFEYWLAPGQARLLLRDEL
ncbi:MAG: alpha-amylase family glycosyl hydrolase [Promethearchaeota archaeon]